MITIAVVTPGLSYLRRLANSGKTWAEITVSGLTGEVSFTSLSYVSTEPCRKFTSQPAGAEDGKCVKSLPRADLSRSGQLVFVFGRRSRSPREPAQMTLPPS